ncbi:type I restriction endonuclease [Acidithiobacillus sp.]|jgi:type I restriction enzyme R subunit|uniref:type I restriction endonuclease n=1 Tax=Acidithiobacillus sp. TaxID=1872118 RepID=UPI0025BF1C9F|nr:type I restriction endonuclease [Acidithiobacillus sp.]MCK9189777.1 type I restriction endonuclease [Acidithiobacillus sp.]MCK9358238.1 type I restriction endonuclease [Acidithiobacillus sp.]
MPAPIGARERHAQDRIIHLFQHTLGYQYLGNWKDRPDNRPIEETLLTRYLQKQGYTTALISRALHELQTIAGDSTQPLYNVNRAVHGLLRYGVKVKADTGEQTQTVWLIDWKHPENNHFGLAEEVTVKGTHDKRPDLVLYVNGIALGIIELKRSTISITEGIRQHLDNQKVEFIERFFAPLQLLLAGNDTEGVRYGTIGTPEKYYRSWKEPSPIENLLDRHLTQLCSKARFLELVHDFIVFDAGIKKTPRHNQYFGVKAS